MFRSKNLSKDGVEQMVMHYEERRREKVRVLLEVKTSLLRIFLNGIFRKELFSLRTKRMVISVSHSRR